MAAHAFAVVCAWCKRTITAGPTGSPVTHTICPSCIEWAMTHPLEIPPPITDPGYFSAAESDFTVLKH